MFFSCMVRQCLCPGVGAVSVVSSAVNMTIALPSGSYTCIQPRFEYLYIMHSGCIWCGWSDGRKTRKGTETIEKMKSISCWEKHP